MDELQQEIIKIGQHIYPNQDPGATTGTSSTDSEEDN